MTRVRARPVLSSSFTEKEEEARDTELSPGKRWKVVEVQKNGVYSRNPYPGAREAKLGHK
jgi:hypothetical protein